MSDLGKTTQPAFTDTWITGDFLIERFSHEDYRLKPNNANCSLVMTGADVEFEFTVPFTFKMDRVVIRHLDGALAESVTELEATFQRDQGDITGMPLGKEMYWSKKQLNAANMTIDFTDKKLKFESGKHSWTFNGTTDHELIVAIYIVRKFY